MSYVTPHPSSSAHPSAFLPRRGFLRLPPLYTGVVARRAVLAWALLHAAGIALTLIGDLGNPFEVDLAAMVPIALLTAAVTGLDLRRRNFHRLLPTLGVSFPTLLATAAAGALLLEILYAVTVRLLIP